MRRYFAIAAALVVACSGAEDAWVTLDSVTGNTVTFTMDGNFKIYDEKGEGPIARASASGTAVARSDS